MSRLGEHEVEGVVDNGAVVAVFERYAGEGAEHVEPGHERGIELQRRYVLRHRSYKFGVQPGLDCLYLFLRAENLLLVVFQLGGDVAFGVHEGLLAYPRRRHLVLVGVRYLDIVPENIVVAYFQGGYGRFLYFACL